MSARRIVTNQAGGHTKGRWMPGSQVATEGRSVEPWALAGPKLAR